MGRETKQRQDHSRESDRSTHSGGSIYQRQKRRSPNPLDKPRLPSPRALPTALGFPSCLPSLGCASPTLPHISVIEALSHKIQTARAEAYAPQPIKTISCPKSKRAPEQTNHRARACPAAPHHF
ncbi:unnamed protein product [Tuber aestivum]|uniref:Uncharacterized protein n=1 Tax=Tuber aestivum TaxID=59557 RepID=A0A292Q2I6_9PEZI|nr:unnamed protein product [Tuber aestivum]